MTPDSVNKLISIINSEVASPKEKLKEIETLKKNHIKLEPSQRKALLDAITRLPLNLSGPLTKWLIDSENVDNYTQLRESLFSVIIYALEKKVGKPEDILFLLDNFVNIMNISKGGEKYLLPLGNAFYQYINGDDSDQMLKALLLRPPLQDGDLVFLKEMKLEMWQMRTPNLSNLTFLIFYQTFEGQKAYNILLLKKIRKFSDPIDILSVLSIFADNIDLLWLFRNDEIDILAELANHRDKTVAKVARELLYEVLHIDKTIDPVKWWNQNKKNFDFDSYIKKIILNPKIDLNGRSDAISQLCSSSDSLNQENIDFLLKIANDTNAGDIRLYAALVIRNYISTEELVKLMREFLEQKYWQRMAMHIIANTKRQLRDKPIEQKIKQILCDNNEELRTRIYYALPAFTKITIHKKSAAILILDLIEKNPNWRDENSPDSLQIPVYNALQTLIGKAVNNDMVLLCKAVYEMPDDPPEEEIKTEK